MMERTETTVTSLQPTTPTDVTGVLVIGAGQMGSGIAQVFAQSGRSVWVSDVAPAALEKARTGIAASASKLHSKGVITEQQLEAVSENITFVTGLDVPHGEIQLVVEAVLEEVAAKVDLFSELDRIMPQGVVFATNTSSISITQIAAATDRPERVIGMHFMNPVPMLELVEVIPGLATAPAITTLVCDLARDLGKVPIESSDSPGFIANRILMPMINEAFFCLHESVGTPEAIDDAMRLGMRHPLGPLALSDLIGLDTCLNIMEVLHADLGDDKYRPCPLLRRYVAAGQLGRKSGAGVYRYDSR